MHVHAKLSRICAKLSTFECKTCKIGAFSYFWHKLTKFFQISSSFKAISDKNYVQNFIKVNFDSAKMSVLEGLGSWIPGSQLSATLRYQLLFTYWLLYCTIALLRVKITKNWSSQCLEKRASKLVLSLTEWKNWEKGRGFLFLPYFISQQQNEFEWPRYTSTKQLLNTTKRPKVIQSN